jgi:hypothetical protein
VQGDKGEFGMAWGSWSDWGHGECRPTIKAKGGIKAHTKQGNKLIFNPLQSSEEVLN